MPPLGILIAPLIIGWSKRLPERLDWGESGRKREETGGSRRKRVKAIESGRKREKTGGKGRIRLKPSALDCHSRGWVSKSKSNRELPFSPVSSCFLLLSPVFSRFLLLPPAFSRFLPLSPAFSRFLLLSPAFSRFLPLSI